MNEVRCYVTSVLTAVAVCISIATFVDRQEMSKKADNLESELHFCKSDLRSAKSRIETHEETVAKLLRQRDDALMDLNILQRNTEGR